MIHFCGSNFRQNLPLAQAEQLIPQPGFYLHANPAAIAAAAAAALTVIVSFWKKILAVSSIVLPKSPSSRFRNGSKIEEPRSWVEKKVNSKKVDDWICVGVVLLFYASTSMV